MDQVTYAGKYIVPVMGVWYDGVDTYNAIKRGEVMSALKSGSWTLFGAVSDGLLIAAPFTAGISGVASGAMKGLRVAGTGAKAAGTVTRLAKVASVLEKIQKGAETAHMAVKTSKIGKYAHGIGMIGMGADLGRQIFDPPKSQKYYL